MIQHAAFTCKGVWRRTRGHHSTAPALFCSGCFSVAPVTDTTLAMASDDNHRRLREGVAAYPGRGT